MVAEMTGNEIAALRRQLGLTQEELAERVGVNRTAVSLWESGDRNPSGPAQMLLGQLASQANRTNPKKSSSRA
jgi:DNA-binding transcriptional regulator YiaG